MEVVAVAPSEELSVDNTGVIETIKALEEKILHTLRIWPFISQSMLHVALGTATPTSLWKPIFQKLVDDGIIKQTQVSGMSPKDRAQTYTVFHLAENPYTYGLGDAT